MFNKSIVNAINCHDLVSDSTLHVIGVISNPARYHSRYRIAREWAATMQATANVKLYLVEHAFGDRHHEIVSAQGDHMKVRSSSELWLKENMLNLGVRMLPRDWKYMAWIDADVWFRNDNWAIETLHQLQHFDVIQPWSECIDLGPYGNALSMFRSFVSLSSKGVKLQPQVGGAYPYGHSGFAWACTRTFWENTGGLIDFAILGAGDHHMAWATVGKAEESIPKAMSEAYKSRVVDWQHRAVQVTNKFIGYVPGRLEHMWHGSKKRRFYKERWKILIDNQYDPDKDLRHDAQGLIQLVGKPKLAHDIHKYLRSRHEDSIEED